MDKYAICDNCEWHGLRTDLVTGASPLDECCPECGSDDTWWTDEAPKDVDNGS
jgi:hypothetical protein